MRLRGLLGVTIAVYGLVGSAVWAGEATVLLVDKKKNTLELAQYHDEKYITLKTYRATVGKVKGDKVDEGDLKTPEGIYSFTGHYKPPAIKAKFGVMAFYMDYPNPWDRLAGHTGNNIMLHGTNEPERLKKDFDSEGCVVLVNEDLLELEPKIVPGLTLILVFDELKDEYRAPRGDQKLTQFFESWIQSWMAKDIDTYIKGYHTDFNAEKKNREQWRDYKSSLNKKYASIDVKAEDIRYYRHLKYNVVTFTQDYHSKYKNGATAFKSRGTKTLYIAQERGEYRIISEQYTPRTW